MQEYKNYNKLSTCKDLGLQGSRLVYKQQGFALVIDLCLCQSVKRKRKKKNIFILDDVMVINSSCMERFLKVQCRVL